MSFQFPSLSAALYRLFRLRRLYVFCCAIPLVVAALQAAVLQFSGGQPAFSIAALAPVVFLTIGLHILIFPRSHAETLAISSTLAFLVLAHPLAGNSVIGWVVMVLVGLFAGIMLQGRVTRSEMLSHEGPATLRAAVTTRADMDAARAHFALRPGQENARFLCGPADADGVFPVDVRDPAADESEALLSVFMPDEGADDWPQDFDEDPDAWRADLDEEARNLLDAAEHDSHGPAFWAAILHDTPERQVTLMLSENEAGRLEEYARVVTDFQPRKTGCKVTETEHTKAFPRVGRFMMWLTDFQADGLVFARDELEGRKTQALRGLASHSLLILMGMATMMLMARRMRAEAE